MDQDSSIEEGVVMKADLELVKPVSDAHFDVLKPLAQHHSMFKAQTADPEDQEKGEYILLSDADNSLLGTFDKPLPFFGCGIGWFSFLLGFAFPLMWYFATILYFWNYKRKDPRERAGLAASAICAMGCSLTLFIIALIFLL